MENTKNSSLIKGYVRLDDLQESDISLSKSGKRYLNIVMIPTTSKYGDDFMIVTDSPKGEKGTVLGNMRYLGKDKKEESTQDSSTKGTFKFEL